MKKVISTLLAVIMCVSLLIGCGNTETPVDTPPSEPEETEEKVDAVEEKKTEEKEEAAESEEEKGFDEESWLPLSDSNEVLTLGIIQSAKVADYDNNELTKWLESETGIDIQFAYFSGSTSEVQQQVSLMVAGGETLPDILWSMKFDVGFVNELGRDGYLVDLNQMIGTETTPYINKAFAELPESYYDRMMNNILDTSSGSIYVLSAVSELTVWDYLQTIGWINQKWLDAVGLGMPKNIDELHEVLVAFRDKDPNGNGKADEIPMIGSNGSGGGNMLGYIINAYIYLDDDNHLNATDGKIWAPFASDEYREALKTIHAWTEEGLIEPHCFTGLENADAKAIFTPEDQVAVAGIICGHSSVVMNADNPVFYEYVPLEYIQESETDKGGYLVMRPGSVTGRQSMITADCKNPELAMKLIDFIYKPEVAASFRHGIQGVNWDWVDPEQTNRSVKNIQVLDDGQAFFAGIYTWCSNTATVLTNNNYLNGGKAATEWLQYELDCEHIMEEGMLTAKTPEEVVTDIAYTAEEREYYNSVKQVVTDYIKEARAKFGTGVWDPNNDADWQTYLNELEAIGLSKYIENAQGAYTRMKTK